MSLSKALNRLGNCWLLNRSMSYNALPTVLKAHRHHRNQSPQPNTARPLGGLYSSCSLSSPLLTQQDLNSSYLPLNTYPAAECTVTPQPCQLLKGNHVKCCQLRAGSWGHDDLSAGTQQAETRVLPASKKLKSTSFKCHWDLVTLHYLIASKNKHNNMHRGYLLQQLVEKNYTNALPQLETHSKL